MGKNILKDITEFMINKLFFRIHVANICMTEWRFKTTFSITRQETLIIQSSGKYIYNI